MATTLKIGQRVALRSDAAPERTELPEGLNIGWVTAYPDAEDDFDVIVRFKGDAPTIFGRLCASEWLEAL